MTSENRRKEILAAANSLKKRTEQNTDGFRVVVTGKGGVGKTTLTALLSHIFAQEGMDVLAVDEDPQQNLAFSLGFPVNGTTKPVPLSHNFDYIEEKVGARPGDGWGLMLTLNPDVADVVGRFGVRISNGLSFLVMGSVVQAATGCLCPENALLNSVIRYIRLRKGEVILLDTQAGVEHFGRALAEGFSQAVVVTEPGYNSVQVALHSAGLAGELGIQTLHLVVNKVRDKGDTEKVKGLLGREHPFTSVFFLPFDEEVLRTEPDVRPLLREKTSFVNGVVRIADVVRDSGLCRGN